MKILVSGENHNVSNFVFSLYMSDCLANVHGTAMSLLYCSPSQQSCTLVIPICNAAFRWSVKGKAVPLEAWSGPEGSRKLKFPDFMTTAQEGGKLVSLTHRPHLPPKIFMVLISVRGWVDPRAIVRSERLCQWNIPMTPSGINPATFRFVAQHLNRCATADPFRWSVPPQILFCHLWLCSIIQKSTLPFIMQSVHLNWYMQHPSLTEGEPLLSGEI